MKMVLHSSENGRENGYMLHNVVVIDEAYPARERERERERGERKGGREEGRGEEGGGRGREGERKGGRESVLTGHIRTTLHTHIEA